MSSNDLDALLRVTSSTYRGETPPDIAFGTYDGAVGRLVLAVTGKGIAACSFEAENDVYELVTRHVGSFIGPEARRLDPVRRELDAYFSGRLRTFTTPVDLALATPFARSVLQKTTAVPYGTTTTLEHRPAARATGDRQRAGLQPRLRDRALPPGGARGRRARRLRGRSGRQAAPAQRRAAYRRSGQVALTGARAAAGR
jgi:hypothetical protein